MNLKNKMLLMMSGNPKNRYLRKIYGIFGSSNVLAYFPLWESAGTVCTDVKGGNNGAYSVANVTYGDPGIGDGRTSVTLSGGYANIYTAGLNTLFNPLEFTILCWGKVSAAGIWTDGLAHTIVALGTDAANYISLAKTATNGTINALYLAGATAKSRSISLISASGFFCAGMTVSKSNDRLIGYYNGSAMSVAITGLGVWSGALANTRNNIGIRISTGTEPWSGSLAHCVIVNGEATAAQMLAVGVPLV